MVRVLAGKQSRLVALLIVPTMLVAACDDGRPFSRSRIGSAATKLAVPTTMTPPVRVGKIQGAPASWKMRERVAEALRDRDIPAGIDIKGSTVYELRGRIVRTTAGGRVRQVNVVWALFTPAGKRVGQATQFASLPDKTNDDVIEAVADSAAESIAPIVPSTRLAYADNVHSGEAAKKTRALYEKKNPQTAIGRLGLKKSGVARNLKAHADAKAGRSADSVGVDTQAAKTTSGALKTRATVMSRRLDQGSAKTGVAKPARRTVGSGRDISKTDVRSAGSISGKVATTKTARKTETALGRLGSGKSALSRNLARGIKPAKQSSTARRIARISTMAGSSKAATSKSGTPARKTVPTVDERLAMKKPAAVRKKRTAPALIVLTEFYLPRRKLRRPVGRITRPTIRRRPVKKPVAAPAKKRPAASVPVARKSVVGGAPNQISEARPPRQRFNPLQRAAFLSD